MELHLSIIEECAQPISLQLASTVALTLPGPMAETLLTASQEPPI